MVELLNAIDKRTQTPEFQALLEANTAERIAAANRNVTHADFVAGVQSGTMGFKCTAGRPFKLISGARRSIFAVLVLLYTVAPIVFISLWAWQEHNWWLLLGIVTSFVGTGIAVSLIYMPQKQISVGALLLITFVASWLSLGFHNYFTFLALCALWGLVLFMVADNAEQEYAMHSLMAKPELFNEAISRNWIMVVRQ